MSPQLEKRIVFLKVRNKKIKRIAIIKAVHSKSSSCVELKEGSVL
jgi:hypothetical protein